MFRSILILTAHSHQKSLFEKRETTSLSLNWQISWLWNSKIAIFRIKDQTKYSLSGH